MTDMRPRNNKNNCTDQQNIVARRKLVGLTRHTYYVTDKVHNQFKEIEIQLIKDLDP